MRSRSRRLVPELAGSIGIGSIAAAIALADGTDDRVAWGLWVVIAARSVAAISHVRTQIARAHDRPAPLWHTDAAQLAAVAIAVIAWGADMVPLAAAVAIAVLAAIDMAAVRLAPRPAVLIGIQQTVMGLGVIVVTAVALA